MGGGGGGAFRCVLCVSVCLCMHKFVGVYDVCVLPDLWGGGGGGWREKWGGHVILNEYISLSAPQFRMR